MLRLKTMYLFFNLLYFLLPFNTVFPHLTSRQVNI